MHKLGFLHWYDQTHFRIKAILSTKGDPYKQILQCFKDKPDIKINLSSLLFGKSTVFMWKGLFIRTEVINTILPAASQSSFLSPFLCLSLSVLPSQRLAGSSARGALGCKALHVEGEGETNKSALVLQKQAHRCMPVKRSVRLLWLP